MNRLLARWVMVALPLTVTLAVAGPGPAVAHETGSAGAVRLVVGWGDEPAYTGFKNSVQVTITEANGGAAVTDIGDALKVEVIKGSGRTSLGLVANFRVGGFGTAGDYRAWLTPTRPGAYTFRLTGSIRGQNVDQSFTSSPTTFNDVEDVASIQFPAKDPSNGQLVTRIDREVPRLEAGLRQAGETAQDALTLAVVGAGVGALGLLAAAGLLVVMLRSREKSAREPALPVAERARPNA